MWPAVSIDEVFQRTKFAARLDPTGERLVSMLFAPKTATVWDELASARADLDQIAGPSWDLFFMGVPSVTRREIPYSPDWAEHHDYRSLIAAQDHVHKAHLHALARAGLDHEPWRYMGGVEVVSFLYRGSEPDWLSLSTGTVSSASGNPQNLNELAWRQKRWREGDEDVLFWSNPHLQAGSQLGLVAAAVALTGTVAVGATGNAAWELTKAAGKLVANAAGAQ